eukprot:CAMPEP_0176425086 /NCGR_PEP_ID=MMETSP0127-20121128/11202_1 /TAXON_ID=938130 /ORGANISM="Platyophrya macrostoma, Strain WH" /LENGTH=343 /DNA_ID=CAMNT_0017806225 /DNA_START=740 /DNA_END=1774 /DNA_ORIENTATION=+
MPFVWAQKPNLKWSPGANFLLSQEHNTEVAKKHFDNVVKNYGSVVLVNLIDKKGTQKMLGDEFQRVVHVANNPKVRYVWFDFHHECRKMKYQNLSILLAQIQIDIDQMGFFEATLKKQSTASSFTFGTRQHGVVRTNCMDSLDRTNVVQSVIARRVLHDCLIKADLHKVSGTIAPFEVLPGDLEKIFRETWTTNANAMSLLYTGTNAQKTDFTRLGKRTFKGMLDDGKAGVIRYVKNNFYDGYNQDCLDLALGRLNPIQVQYKKSMLNRFYLLVFIVFVFPILMKLMLDSVHENLFSKNVVSKTYELKANCFYYTVMVLTFLTIFKAITSSAAIFIVKPFLHH